MARVIFHIDMNCFFASCEIAENPSLKGKPMCVAHKSMDKKGMVLTASYEAKKMGIKTTFPVFMAERLCPGIIVVEPHHELYEEYSKRFFEYFYSLTNLVEPASIDEAYLDVTDLSTGDGYLKLAENIQQTLLNKYKLPCSIGIAPNKFLAKMASDIKKPLGITVLRKKDVEKIMWPLPIEDFFGCGKKTSSVLRLIGINTIGDFVHFKDQKKLENLLGKSGYDYMMSHAYGNGSSEIDTESHKNISSMSADHTLFQAEFNSDLLIKEIKKLTEVISNRLIKHHFKAMNFSLMLRFADRSSISKSITLKQGINDLDTINHHIIGLFDEIFTGEYGVRMLSVHAGKFETEKEERFKQLSIFDSFDDCDKVQDIDRLLDQINNQFGEGTIKKGCR